PHGLDGIGLGRRNGRNQRGSQCDRRESKGSFQVDSSCYCGTVSRATIPTHKLRRNKQMALPLEGIKVLDLSNIMAGPYCTMVLGDMGAEVTKVETFPEGDGSRRFEPKVNGESYCFAVLNRNKKSLALNMKDPRGKEIFLKLAAQADIITENFR